MREGYEETDTSDTSDIYKKDLYSSPLLDDANKQNSNSNGITGVVNEIDEETSANEEASSLRKKQESTNL